MSEIILRATAIKIVNKGGGTMRKMVPVEGDGSKLQIMEKKDTGSDYIVFRCANPRCGRRNKMSMFESEPYFDTANDRVPFKCRTCRTVNEVTRPFTRPALIIPG